MADLTIIYITSNKEKEEFESKIREKLLEASKGLPIVSVSQKPIAFGKNICIGDVGVSAENILKQIKIGCENAETKYIGLAESDFLFPRGYFDFRPPSDDTFYYPDEIYLLWEHRNRFYRKRPRELLSITNRLHMLNVVNKLLNMSMSHITGMVKHLTKQDIFKTPASVITFKTRRGLHWKSPYARTGHTNSLPYWGTAEQLRKEYL